MLGAAALKALLKVKIESQWNVNGENEEALEDFKIAKIEAQWNINLFIKLSRYNMELVKTET